MMEMHDAGQGMTRMVYIAPTRGLLGFRYQFLTSTRGTGLLTTLLDGWEPWGGVMAKRQLGAIVADRMGVATPYAMNHLQARGEFFISPNIGEAPAWWTLADPEGNEADVSTSMSREG